MIWLWQDWGEDGRDVAWPLLERAAAQVWGWEKLPEVARSPRGKPYFPGEPGRWFSLSHSGGLALCALSDSGEVGVDVELVRPRNPRLFERALGARERALCGGSWEEFYRFWTLKESWCKLRDAPLWPPDRVETPPPCPHWRLTGPGWRGALCAEVCPGNDTGAVR